MVLPFVNMDQFAESGGNNQYTVRSIYFDTPAYDFYQEKVEGIKNRKKVRLRGYDLEDEKNTVFFEIKRKYSIPIIKYRAPVTFMDAQSIFKERDINGHILFKDSFPKGTENAQRFFYQLFSKNMQPVVLIVYEREAYLSKFDSTVRVTFDKNLRSSAYPTINELYREDDIKPALDGNFILEIKFNKSFPGWMQPIVALLGLKKQSASKYVISMDNNKIVKNVTQSRIYTRSQWFNN